MTQTYSCIGLQDQAPSDLTFAVKRRGNSTWEWTNAPPLRSIKYVKKQIWSRSENLQAPIKYGPVRRQNTPILQPSGASVLF